MQQSSQRLPFSPQGASMPLNRQTIVIVDDDPQVGLALKRALSAWGYHVELHGSVEECLDAAVTGTAGCLVIDVHLGADCGIELAARLSARGLRTPVIHMSGAADDLIRQRSREAGSVTFLEKPFDISWLVQAIERATAHTATD
jgi:FixJ family two-component response regulator